MKYNLPVTLCYSVPNHPDEISDFLRKVTADINLYTILAPRVSSNVKLILIELSTNFIKHVKTSTGVIKVALEKHSIVITKRYQENCFFEVIKNKINVVKFGEINELYFSLTNNHYIEVMADSKFRFLNPLDNGLYSNELKDHYGLHILTLASEYFSYEYDHEACEDCFTARIQY